MTHEPQSTKELREHLECSMLSLRQQAISLLVQELMVVLQKQGYFLDDLLEALAQYSEARPEWVRVTELLDRAVDVVRDLRRQNN